VQIITFRRLAGIWGMKTLSRLLIALTFLIACPLWADTKPATRPSAVAALPPGVTAEYDLRYGEAPGVANLLDLYLPAKLDNVRPLIIWVHGGGWSAGDKKMPPGVSMVVERGYAVASLNYRLSQQAVYPAQIQDCKGAVRWLRAHAAQYHLDPKHFGVWGASAGGHLVALLGTSGEAKELEGNVGGNLDQSSRVQCVCDWFGPTDMSVFFDQAAAVPNIFKGDPNRSPIVALFGGPLAERLDLVKLANPITFVKKDNPPFLIVHGDKDALVPLAQSEMLDAALKKAGVESNLEVLAGAGHGNGFGKPDLLAKMSAFFDKHLKTTGK
jgi:acetyl esterase/lipase